MTPATAHPLCRICRDGTYATMTLQPIPGQDKPWEPYCDGCGKALASVVQDCYQHRKAEIKALPKPPEGKAEKPAKAVKVEEPAAKGRTKASAPVQPPPVAVAAPPKPRVDLMSVLRPPVPAPAPVPVPVPAPVSLKAARAALRSQVQDESHDLLAMLGMKR